jgi:hypothetical protein
MRTGLRCVPIAHASGGCAAVQIDPEVGGDWQWLRDSVLFPTKQIAAGRRVVE